MVIRTILKSSFETSAFKSSGNKAEIPGKIDIIVVIKIKNNCFIMGAYTINYTINKEQGNLE
jgi:hypothetical protein